ncbi:hypothetical protein Tco_0311708 [Tanacetum coccineum]
MQSSSVSFDFANQFLNLDNVLPSDTEVVSMMNVKVCHEEPSTQTPPLLNIPVIVILETSTATGTTISLTIPPITPFQQQSAPTPTSTPTTTTFIPALPDFSSLFGFDQRVSALEKGLSQLKQVDYSAQLLEMIKSQIPPMVDAQLNTRLEDSIKKSFRSYTAEFEKKAKDERKRYIDLVEKSVKEIIKDEVKSQLPQNLPKEVSDYATKAPLLNHLRIKSYRGAQERRDLYDALVKSYKLDKELFESNRKAYSLKRDREDKDKDEDPSARSDQGLKKWKTSKDAEPSKGSKSKESKSNSSKGTKSQSKSSGKSAQAEESVFETADTEMDDWFKKPERPSTTDSDWNTTKIIDFIPPQTWISKIAKAEKPPHTFDELMITPIDFSKYVMNNLKIENLTQEHLIEPAFNLLKWTCRSRVELEYHFEECYKVVTDRLDWNNPEGHEYPFDLSKPLSLIED